MSNIISLFDYTKIITNVLRWLGSTIAHSPHRKSSMLLDFSENPNHIGIKKFLYIILYSLQILNK